MQSGEILPDAACYDNCKDTPEQRHFLTCIEMSCYCRKASPLNSAPPPPPPQAAVPLNADVAAAQPPPSLNGQNPIGSSVTINATNNSTNSTNPAPMAPGALAPPSGAQIPVNSMPSNPINATIQSPPPAINTGTAISPVGNPQVQNANQTVISNVTAPVAPVPPQVPQAVPQA